MPDLSVTETIDLIATQERRQFRAIIIGSALIVIVWASLAYAAYQRLHSLRVEIAEEQQQQQKLTSAVARLIQQKQALEGKVGKDIPLQYLVKPLLSSSEVPGLRDVHGHQVFDFILYVYVPPSRVSELESVAYVINHPERLRPLVRSDDQLGQFAVKYRGTGCFAPVIVRVTPKSKPTFDLPFDMCDAWRAEAAARAHAQ